MSRTETAHAYAILRDDAFLAGVEPKERIALKTIVADVTTAEAEVARLSRLNAEKGAVYFWQPARFDPATLILAVAGPMPDEDAIGAEIGQLVTGLINEYHERLDARRDGPSFDMQEFHDWQVGWCEKFLGVVKRVRGEALLAAGVIPSPDEADEEA